MDREITADCDDGYDDFSSYDPGADRTSTLEEVHREHFAFVWRTLRHLGVPPAAVDDAAQDVFLVVHRRLEDFEGRSDVQTWLFSIARRVAYRHRRTAERQRRKLHALSEVGHDPRLPDAGSHSPEATLAREEAVEILAHFIDSLDQEKREVFVLHTLEGVSGREIATNLGISVNTVHSRLRLARRRFDAMCGRLRVGEDRVIAQTRAAHQPPPGSQRRAWAIMIPLVDLPAPMTLTGTAAWTLVAKAKLFAATVVVGTLGVGTVDMVREASADAPETVLASSTPAPAASPPGDRPTAAAQPEAVAAAEHELPTKPGAPPTVQRQPADVSDLVRETQLMGKVRSLVRDDGTAALELIARADDLFPQGSFAVEREAYRAMALCSAGREREGRGAANLFAERHPGASILDQVTSSCLVP